MTRLEEIMAALRQAVYDALHAAADEIRDRVADISARVDDLHAELGHAEEDADA